LSTQTQEEVPDARTFIAQTEKKVRDAMVVAQEQQRNAADLHRSTPHDFRIGDRVLLHRDRAHETAENQSTKLKWKPIWHGPYRIRSIKNNSAELKMPDNFKGHRIFNIADLMPWHESSHERQEKAELQVSGPETEVKETDKVLVTPINAPRTSSRARRVPSRFL
jgi:hypothetical protein